MSPFNYRRARLGAPVKTGRGERVTEVYVFKSATKSPTPLAAVVEGKIRHYTVQGRMFPWTRSKDDLYLDI